MSSFKKKSINYDPYDDYLYTGLQGLFMRQNHKILSKNVDPKFNNKILEIGGGAKAHCSLVDLVGVNEYWISDLEEVIAKKPFMAPSKFDFSIKTHIFDKDPDYNEFLQNGHRFSRIIVSHVWEHVNDPEASLLQWLELLEDFGQLDIAIPCDPGWLGRLGQLISRKGCRTLWNNLKKLIWIWQVNM